jgi:hypothetical protein
MMAEQNTEIAEIRMAEKRRAQKVVESGILEQWVKELRKKYIADGFLMPFYAGDGRYSRPRQRISKLGDFILQYDMLGKVFREEAPLSWVHHEEMWFWEYLISGQEAIFARKVSSLADPLHIEGIPAKQVWSLITDGARQFELFGETGGGLIFSPDDLDEKKLAEIAPKNSNYEGENGYFEIHEVEGEPRWITIFHEYEEPEYAKLEFEIRPAWFHLVNYAFFNAQITRLPVFLGIFKEGKLNTIRLLEDSLSDQARDFILRALSSMPNMLKKQLDTETIRRESNEITWWLWHNVGYRQRKRTLSYFEIAHIARKPRSSVQTSVTRFSRKLKEKMDNKLLERLMRASGNLGLGYNMTYNVLVGQGFVPARERDIDGFDQLDDLI